MGKPTASNDVVVRLFARLSASYGRLFTKQVDGDGALKMAMVVWAEQLHGLSLAEIASGVDKLPKDFPPNPFQFRALCLPVVIASASHRAFAALPRPPRDVNLARESMLKIKQSLRGVA